MLKIRAEDSREKSRTRSAERKKETISIACLFTSPLSLLPM
jgi:hypothetical protein